MFGFLKMKYFPRLIDAHLLSWAQNEDHKPLLLRGARQVGKSRTVRHLGENFENFIEINFEKSPLYKNIFQKDLNIERIISEISMITGIPIQDGKTLLFFDEIQDCPNALMALRFFREDRRNLHVISAGSLLEFTLEDLPTFGVGRIRSMFMYPMTFDEFLLANNEKLLLDGRNKADTHNPLPEVVKMKLTDYFRKYILVGGMPEVVAKWVNTGDYLSCQEIQDDLILTYETDFAKYKASIDPVLLRDTLRSAALQITSRFVFSRVSKEYKTYQVKKAISMLVSAGLLTPVKRSHGNGLPLGGETQEDSFKLLLLDTGLTLRLLRFTLGDNREMITHILTSDESQLVNKGPMAEFLAGLELIRYHSPTMRHDLYYWEREERNSKAEVDYLQAHNGSVLPIEVKAGTQGGMKSLWMFMKAKQIKNGVKCSLDNFGRVTPPSGDAQLNVINCPLYAISQLDRVLND